MALKISNTIFSASRKDEMLKMGALDVSAYGESNEEKSKFSSQREFFRNFLKLELIWSEKAADTSRKVHSKRTL